MGYDAVDLRKTFVLDGSEESLVVDSVDVDDTVITINLSTDDLNGGDFANINVDLSGTGVDEQFEASVLPNAEVSRSWDFDYLEDGEEFTITANITEPEELLQSDQWKFEIAATGDDKDDSAVSDGDVILEVSDCGLDSEAESVDVEIEYVDGGPLISDIIVEAEVDGQYAGETSVAGQSIGPGETASGSISIEPPTEPGEYPVRVGIVSGSWRTW